MKDSDSGKASPNVCGSKVTSAGLPESAIPLDCSSDNLPPL